MSLQAALIAIERSPQKRPVRGWQSPGAQGVWPETRVDEASRAKDTGFHAEGPRVHRTESSNNGKFVLKFHTSRWTALAPNYSYEF